jgi:hypothetical protein
MNKELELKLVAMFPNIFRDYGGSIYETCMGWGITCGDGWFDILRNACEEVEEALLDTGIVLIADQVKEKFGGLRFYYHFEGIPKRPAIMEFAEKQLDWLTGKMCWYGFAKQRWWLHRARRKVFETKMEKARSAISRAEMKSYETCEDCGRPGKRHPGRWIATLCEYHWALGEVRAMKSGLENLKKHGMYF